MIIAKSKLQEIIGLISQKFPDEPDLKGFLGISKTIIISILDESQLFIEKLSEFNDHFEVIILKRELAELFSKIKGNLKKDFSQINGGSFNSVLRMIATVKQTVVNTYFSVVNEANVRAEAELLRIKADLSTLSNDTEELKNVKQTLLNLQIETSKTVEMSLTELADRKNAATVLLKDAVAEIEGLKQNTVSAINSSYDEISNVKDKADLLFAGLAEYEKAASKNFQKVDELSVGIEKRLSAIEGVNNNVQEWNQNIAKINTEFVVIQKTNADLLEQAKQLLSSSQEAHEKIIGKVDEKGIHNGGLMQDAEKLKSEVEIFLAKQTEKYEAQFKEIEAMLPGATSVGLAKAYQEQKDSYRIPLSKWSWIFVITLMVMTGFSGFVLYEQFQKAPITNLNEALTALFRYLPFYIPTIWLVAYASKRQSQARRLQQEYAFKETNAKSFHGHKEQIEKLIKEGGADKELLAKLVEQMVVITGQNPSATLDFQSHDDSPPTFKLVEGIFNLKRKPLNAHKSVSNDGELASMDS